MTSDEAKALLARLKTLFEYRPDTGQFVRVMTVANQPAGSVAGTKDSHGHIQIRIDRRLYLAHRLAWLWQTGEWPADTIDHMNGVRDDNRFANLRHVSKRLNCQNRRNACADSRTGVLGVTRTKYGFVASIWDGGTSVNLGTHKSADLAHAAYLEAKRALHAGCTL